MKSKPVIWFEYGLFKTVQLIENALPYPVAMAVAAGFARFVFHVVQYRRERTFARIRGVFPEKSEAEVRHIAYCSLRHVFWNAVEMMRTRHFTRKWMDKYVCDGPKYRDMLQGLVDEGNGVVVMVPHSANFYMAAWALAHYGLKLISIGARFRNPLLGAWVDRQHGEVKVYDRDDKHTLVRIVRGLREGRAFAIMPDLRLRHREVDVEFLRGHANVSRAGAAFAVKCGCPILVAIMHRDGLRHVYEPLGVLRPDPAAIDKKEEAERLTREAFKLLDVAVCRRPDEWYWYNKRWILEPVTE